MLQPFGFATGGYDHRIHIWDVKDDMSMPSPTELPVKHSSMVQSLLPIRDTSHKLVSAGADCTVHFWDLSSERVVNTLKTSNAVYHVHEVLSPFCTLLEIAHRELQFEIRDHRMAPVLPVQRFGYAAPRSHGRYVKGKCGTVRLWDLRDVSKCSNTMGSVVIYDDEYLVACSEDHELAFIMHT
ncbi:uncharacterized protein LAESUDRAFT_733541 [Laetiporus sulphureus 93-53]|uniref:Uncharacterized protein n=1 Tax=Laetiporus sulphureus 93-53 TaxID=1314785 RepID=A0A165IF93_9APHY|nr:uncharacterized protein LAESUDRAFT_733541 [Laetiporus sulphureus 93-53]KZT12992.1 hypothetical protein LAESUDRAFT_733541 [Laetiporus sulphureus 93-53]